MSKRIAKVLTTGNKKGVTFEDDRIRQHPDFTDFEMPKDATIAVLVEIDVPDNAQEAASADFYGSEEQVTKTLQQDWARVCLNAGRPLLRDADSADALVSLAQQAADTYKPGRRGGFAPKVDEAAFDEAAEAALASGDIASLKAFLQSQGVKVVGAQA